MCVGCPKNVPLRVPPPPTNEELKKLGFRGDADLPREKKSDA